MTLEPEAEGNPQNGHGEGGEEEKKECEERRKEGALEEEGEQGPITSGLRRWTETVSVQETNWRVKKWGEREIT